MEAPKSADEIAAELAALRAQYAEIKVNFAVTEDLTRQAKAAAEEARQAYLKADDKWVNYRNELDNLKYSSANMPTRIKTLENQLQAEMFKQKMQEGIKKSIEEFKARTLAASWRKENRSDGLGAMPHQIDGAFTIALNSTKTTGGGYVFDKRGLGKTLTSLIIADLTDVAKLVIVVPNDVASQYVKEVQRWTPHRSVIPFYQLPASQRTMMFSVLGGMSEWTIVINYEAWRRDFSIVQEINKLQPTCIIADEAHLINKTALKQWQGVWYIRSHPNMCPECQYNDIYYDTKLHKAVCKDCGHNGYFNNGGKFSEKNFEWLSVKSVVPMTGSPFLNRPQELYPLLRLVQPDEFFNEEEYTSDYCLHLRGTRFTWRTGGQEALIRRIKDRLIQRDRKSANVTIPPQEVQIHEIVLDPEEYPKQARALDQIKNYAQLVMDSADDTVMNMTVFLEVLLRLRQGITWPAGIKLVVKDLEGKIVDERRLEVYESIKIDWTINMLKQLVSEGERVLVFSHFVEPLNELNRRLNALDISNVLYYGATPDHIKIEAKNDFDPNSCGDNPKYSVLLGHYRAAGTGLNLHAATNVIILDDEWSPGKLDQAMGRVDRIGTTQQTTVHIPRVINSVADQFMAGLHKEKAEAVGSFESAAKLITGLRDAIHRKDLM